MPSPFTPAKLAKARAKIADKAMPDTCEILHVTTTTDDLGAPREVVDTAGTVVPCSYVEEFSVRQQGFVSRIDAAVSGRLVVPYSADIRETDHITNLTLGGVVQTTTIDGTEVPATYGVRSLPPRSIQIKTVAYIGRL